ncbi:hypothetical protein K501DRAFT_268849 [Backusella circina FSU 941]|nr:hypothetical protein K501DRAFT_268849 [Backusella circina FSU 941]
MEFQESHTNYSISNKGTIVSHRTSSVTLPNQDCLIKQLITLDYMYRYSLFTLMYQALIGDVPEGHFVSIKGDSSDISIRSEVDVSNFDCIEVEHNIRFCHPSTVDKYLKSGEVFQDRYKFELIPRPFSDMVEGLAYLGTVDDLTNHPVRTCGNLINKSKKTRKLA